MDGRVSANRVKVDELYTKVTLVVLDALVKSLHPSSRSTSWRWR